MVVTVGLGVLFVNQFDSDRGFSQHPLSVFRYNPCHYLSVCRKRFGLNDLQFTLSIVNATLVYSLDANAIHKSPMCIYTQRKKTH